MKSHTDVAENRGFGRRAFLPKKILNAEILVKTKIVCNANTEAVKDVNRAAIHGRFVYNHIVPAIDWID